MLRSAWMAQALRAVCVYVWHVAYAMSHVPFAARMLGRAQQWPEWMFGCSGPHHPFWACREAQRRADQGRALFEPKASLRGPRTA